jgi:DNA polymerase I-like protein with 3'-5' exonuclease and polymerase domains
MRAKTKDAHKLFLEGSVALSQVEANGIRIDVKYLDHAIEKTGREIAEIEKRMRSDPVYKTWKKRFGDSVKLGSREQLGTVLFDIMEYPCKTRTATGRPSTDGSALDVIDLPFVRDFLRAERLKKAKSTNLEGIRREQVNGFLHPNYNLSSGADDTTGGARSFRGSCSAINFQNLPNRDGELGKLVRDCFIPRKGNRQLAEKDFKGIEVGVSACYNKDPVLIDYVKDKSKDMHRDRSMELFFLKKEEVSKHARHLGKNGFVFPEFYGSFYVDCARNIWEELERRQTKVEGSDETVLQRLRKNGIKELGTCSPELKPRPGTFEHHVKKVEDHFWGELFKEYARWKKEFYATYLRKGWFDYYTGFRVTGYYRRNQVVNYPVQGSAFHCLLWCLIRLIKWLRKYRMSSLIVGQIHDSILDDLDCAETEDVIAKSREIMTEDLPEHWPWIITPMDVDIELCPPGGTWFEKRSIL